MQWEQWDLLYFCLLPPNFLLLESFTVTRPPFTCSLCWFLADWEKKGKQNCAALAALPVIQPKLQGLPKKSEPQLPPLFARLLEEDVISPIRKRSHRRSKTRLKFFRWPLSRCAFPAETSSWCSMTAALKTIQRCVYIRVSVCPEIFISFHLLASDCWAILSLSWLRNPTSRPKAK